MEKRTPLETGLDTEFNNKKGAYANLDKVLDGVIAIERKINEEQILNAKDFTSFEKGITAAKKTASAAKSAASRAKSALHEAKSAAEEARLAAKNASDDLEAAKKAYLTDELGEDGEFLTLHEKLNDLDVKLNIFLEKEFKGLNRIVHAHNVKLEEISKSSNWAKVISYVAIASALMAVIISST